MKKVSIILLITAAVFLSSCGNQHVELASKPEPAISVTSVPDVPMVEQPQASLIMYKGQLYVLSNIAYDTPFFTERGEYIGIVAYETDRNGVPTIELGTNDTAVANYELYSYVDGQICVAIDRENWIYMSYSPQKTDTVGFESESEIIAACTDYALQWHYEAEIEGECAPAFEKIPDGLRYLGTFEKTAAFPPYTGCRMQIWYREYPLTVVVYEEAPSDTQMPTWLRNYDRVQMPLTPTPRMPYTPTWSWVKYQTHYETSTAVSNIRADVYSSGIHSADYIEMLKTVKSVL